MPSAGEFRWGYSVYGTDSIMHMMMLDAAVSTLTGWIGCWTEGRGRGPLAICSLCWKLLGHWKSFLCRQVFTAKT